jgi:PAS domain S-box-containing protein
MAEQGAGKASGEDDGPDDVYRLLVESFAQATWETDAAGHLGADSPSWRAYTGQTFDEMIGRGWLNAVHPADRDYAEKQWREAIVGGHLVDAEFRVMHAASGGYRWSNVRAMPLRGPGGEIRKWVGINIDIHQRKPEREAVRESEERLEQFGEASSDVLWIRDAQTLQWEYLSPAFERIYGVSRQQALAGNNLLQWSELILQEDRTVALDHIGSVRAGQRATYEFRIRRPDGAIRWIRNNDFPMFDDQGRVQRIGGIGRDITTLKDAVEHERLLRAELQHRVRNTLAVVRSIVRRTAETSENPDEFASHLDGRIGAFARVQVALTRDPRAGFDLHELIAENLVACAAREGEQFTLDGPTVRLRPKAAEIMGLTMHELATNAVKHGALTSPNGSICVRWHDEPRAEGNWLVLEWKESGMQGRPVVQAREGFGTAVLQQTLQYDLSALVSRTFDPDGFRCTIQFPLAN